MLWQRLARPLLFLLPAEKAHYFSMGMFKAMFALGIGGVFRWRNKVQEPCLKTKVIGIEFQNPVGLAAGFDKDARWFPQLASLGFSHVEIGTITGEAQSGNPQPRLFRLPADRAIVNRMGFNNSGSDAVARRLAVTPKADASDVLGINIGKTKVVPVEEATQDYLQSFERLFTFADYFTVNVSSPNTPGLRTLQNREPLIDLLSKLIKLNRELSLDHECSPKPILLKIAPDVTEDQLSDIILILREVDLDGVIATNTTIDRAGLATSDRAVEAIGNGGLSGAPLTMRSREVVGKLYDQLKGDIPIVGVGGIMHGEDAWQMIRSGASLVQLYTGFIYGGPATVRLMNRYIADKLKQHGFQSVADAVGSGRVEAGDAK
ncbi:MAG: quinone-dependent dihydroorotate dehydrogenase [Mariniblastus sp.]